MKAPLRRATKVGGHVKSARIDALCLVAVVFVASLPHLAGIGFYTDDWQFLELFRRTLTDWAALPEVATAYPFTPRPGHGAYAALLFLGFGLDPLGYHVVNLAVLAGAVVLLRAVLAELGADRRIAFAVAVTFALLPQLSSIKLWFAAFQITLALFFFLLTCLAELRWARGKGGGWKAFSLASLIASLSLYEIFAPSFVAVFAAAGFLRWQAVRPATRNARIACLAPALIGIAMVAGGLLLKAHVSERAESMTFGSLLRTAATFLRPDYDWRIDNGLNIVAAPLINFGYAIAMPLGAPFRLAGGGAGVAAPVAALLVGMIVAWRLRGAAIPSPARLRALFGAGVVLFGLGFALFVTTRAVIFSPAGIGNRTAIAAALGVAAIFVALACVLARLAPTRHRSTALVAGIALMASCASLRGSEVDRHWARAASAQAEILRRARIDLRTLPAGSTILLDGVCPYDGPGVVFETNWDITGAFTLALGRPIAGDAISPRTRLRGDGVATSIYGVESVYRYAAGLYAYNPARGWVVPLPDAGAARAYLARPGRYPKPCPVGYVGHGVPI